MEIEEKMKKIIKDQGDAAEKLRIIEKKEKLLRVLDDLNQKRIQGDTNIDEDKIIQRHIQAHK